MAMTQVPNWLVGLLIGGVICGVGVVIVGLRGFYTPYPAFDGRSQVAEKTSLVSACTEDMSAYTTVRDAVARGDDYFNGARGYNPACAQQAYERARDIDPRGSIYTWHQLGRLAFLSGDFDRAIAHFVTQYEYFGDSLPNVHYMLGLAYGYRARVSGDVTDWHAAEEEFLKYSALDPGSPWARTDLAWVYFAQGKYESMKAPVSEGLVMHPYNPWLLNMYGLALLHTGEPSAARGYFERALTETQKLSVEEWGHSYPGNAPTSWPEGLAGMREGIEHNLMRATHAASQNP